MVYRIIISHGQASSLAHFPVGVPTIAVFDAPTDADFYMCSGLGYEAVVSPREGNRSLNRNVGLERLLDGAMLAPDDIVEFYDGDRYPVHQPLEGIGKLMDVEGLDVLLYTCEEDARLERHGVPLFRTAPVLTGGLCNPFYSCGFAMRYSAIQKVMAARGSLFEERLDRWGCEDQLLGLWCARLGIRSGLTRAVVLHGKVGGDSQRREGYRESLQQYIDIVREQGLPIDIC